MVVAFQEEGIRILIHMGFTETQAKLYLALLNIGKTDVKTLSKQANVPRQAAYRTLGELQEKGIVEKIISLPQKYAAIPLQDGLKIMISLKANEYAQVIEKAKEFLLKFEAQKQDQISENQFNISIIEGKDTIINKVRALTDGLENNVCVCQTLQRWMQVNLEIVDNVKKALSRGVKYRVVLEKPDEGLSIPKELKQILSHPNYEVQIMPIPLKINAAIYDNKNACFSFYPAKALPDSPVIVTNHPSLLVGFEDHFENLWRESGKIGVKEALTEESIMASDLPFYLW
jgi:sugar-specific transcriptional regulator TrmB